METQLSNIEFQQAILAIEASASPAEEKVETLLELALGLQQTPASPAQLKDALLIYDRALDLCAEGQRLLRARVRARRAEAWQIVPDDRATCLLRARDDMYAALEIIEHEGEAIEVAEFHMNMGLIEHSLSSFHKGDIAQAIFHYQKALPTFNRNDYPAEFAILNHNLATAYLSLPMSDERASMKEALAVESFQAALEVITIENDPIEYALLQNNLGNALQYASSCPDIENNLRALEAYDEALRVRDRRSAPLNYANTISNKVNCLRNLPDYAANPGWGNKKRLAEARVLCEEAASIYAEFGDAEKLQLLNEIIAEIRLEELAEPKT